MADADPGEILAVVTDYPALARAFAARRHELGMSQLEVDQVSGLQDGYTGKLEACIKHLGTISMPSLLGALGLRIALVRDVPHAERQGREVMPIYRPQSRSNITKRRLSG